MSKNVDVGMQIDESKLIQAAQGGDSHALETLFLQYQRPLFRTALRVLGNPEDAEDALQDGMILAYRHRSALKGDRNFQLS